MATRRRLRVVVDSPDKAEGEKTLSKAIAGKDRSPPQRSSFFVSDQAVAGSRARPTRQVRAELRALSERTFRPAQPMPGVVPSSARLAQDEMIAPVLDYDAWAANSYYSSVIAEGTTFLGYAYLSALAQRAEYRVPSETIASEATREWIEVKSAGEDEGKAKVIAKIEAEFDRLSVQEVVCSAVEHDGLLGRGHIYLDTGDTDELDELKTPIGDGRDLASRVKVNPDNPLLAIRTVEPIWTYPSRYNTTDPLKEDWYRPDAWFVMGKEVHRTRLLTLIGRPVNDMLRPAYAFGGLSMSQMLKPYVDNWLRTRQSVSDITHGFSIPVLGTNLNAMLQPDGQHAMFNRADLFNNLRDNRSLMLIDKDGESFQMVQASLGTLDALLAQAQEQMAAIARIPLVKLLGISPHGLNASSEGELKAFYDWIRAFQKRLIAPRLRTIFWFVQLSLFGKVDPDLTFDFKSLWQLDELARAQVNQTKASTYASDVAAGITSSDEVREAYRADKNSQYAGLELEGDAPEQAGALGGMPGEDPLAASESDDEDPSAEGRVDDWRRRAAALFADEEETAYWERRAAALFADEAEPPTGRWAALAAKLAETASESEPLERWARRAARWAERAEMLASEPIEAEFNDAFVREMVGENIVSFQPESISAKRGSERVRWDNYDGMGQSTARSPELAKKHHYRDAAAALPRNVVAQDATVEWSEEKHPRDESGKFAKVEHKNPQFEKVLKSYGYEHHPGFKNTAVYYHPSGHHFAMTAPAVTDFIKKGYTNGIKHLPPKGKASKVLFGKSSLLEKLNEVHGSPEEAKKAAAQVTLSGKVATKQPTSNSGKNKAALQLKIPNEFSDELPLENKKDGSKIYKHGNYDLFINAKGHWTLSTPGIGKPLAYGETQEELNDAVKRHLHSKSSVPVHLPDNVPVKGEQSLSDGGKFYNLEDGNGVGVMPDGNWLIYADKDKGGLQKGSGQEELNKALEKIYPKAAPEESKTEGLLVGLPAPYKGSVAPLPGFEQIYKDKQIAQYKNKDSEVIEIFNDGAWAIQNKNNEIVAEGHVAEGGLTQNQQALNAAFEALHPRGEGGKFVAKPGMVELGDKPFADSVQAPKEFGAPEYTSAFNVSYSTPGFILTIKPNNNWELYGFKNDKIITGTGQKSLEDAYVNIKNIESSISGEASSTATVKKTGSVGAPIDIANLSKVGEQKGSNPGGVYQDPNTGQKYYVKQTQSPDHAKNELLAARLYQLAGAPTLNYHPVGDKDVATEWDELKATNADQLTAAQKKVARKDFATHAWLANWDAVGLSNDNIGVNSKGVPVSLDLGGSLKYRAKGGAKGAAFGDTVPEWNTLRDPSKNPTSAAFFKDMTKEEIAESASRVAKIKDQDIRDAIKAAGYSGAEAEELTEKLIMRRDDVIKRSKEEFAQKSQFKISSGNEPSIDVAPPIHKSNSAWTDIYKARLEAQPDPTKAEAKAITRYSGNSYDAWNKQLRGSFGKNAGSFKDDTQQFDAWLERASFPETAVVRRKVSDNYAAYLIEEAESYAEIGGHEHGQHQFEDHGYISTDNWSGSLTIEITIPKGARAAAVGNYSSHPHENEIVIARGSKFRVTGFDTATMTLKADLIRSGPAKGGVWHIDPKKE